MSKTNQFTAQEVIDAIAGTGGIVSALARKLGCTWNTAHRYIENMPTVKAAYDAEVDSTLDIAESVVLDNIRIARRFQTENKTVVDTSDSKWYLTKKGKRRGYGDAVELGGPDGGPIQHEDVTGLTDDERAERVAGILDAARARRVGQADRGAAGGDV